MEDGVGGVCPICGAVLCGEESAGLATVRPCNHEFCVPCIEQWRTMKNICPLCVQVFTEVVVVPKDGERSVLKVDEPDRAVEDFAVDGLDHAYFLSEVDCLLEDVDGTLRKAQLERQRGANQHVCISVVQDRGWAVLSNASATLHEMRAELSKMEPFDPHMMLAQLYAVENAVRVARGGRSAARPGGTADHLFGLTQREEEKQQENKLEEDYEFECDYDEDFPPLRRKGGGRRMC